MGTDIYQYTRGSYFPGEINLPFHKILNRYNLGIEDSYMDIKLKKYLKHYTDLLNDSLSYLDNYVGKVFRTVTLSEEEIQRYVKGENIIENYFISASYEENLPYRNVKFIIDSLTGKNIETYSQFGLDEKEILFRSGLKFLVEEIVTDGAQTIIHLIEIK